MEAPHLERKLVAVLAADVAGYSRHMERDEVTTLTVLTKHRTVIDDLIADHGGRITSTAGDSVLAEFASVVKCVNCAVRIQEALARANAELSASSRLVFRIGINVGDVMVKDGDIFGDGVNIAARLETLSEPGGICVSRGVRDHLRKSKNLTFEDLGEQKVKNIENAIRAFRIKLAPGERNDEVQPLDQAPEASGAVVHDSGEVAGANIELAQPEVENIEVELAFWKSIEGSEMPDELEAYLTRYPQGAFAALAETRRKSLIEAQSAAESRPTDEVDETSAVELAFWESVKETVNPAELQDYLDRYPEGAFAPLAKTRLDMLASHPRGGEDVQVELAFWDSIKDARDPTMLKAYLEQYPDGSFVSLARIMLEQCIGKDPLDQP